MKKTVTHRTVPIKICGREESIDCRVARLVSALNEIPGVTTSSSCGGHKNPGPCSEPVESFSITLDVPETSEGWRAIEVITLAVQSAMDNFYSRNPHHGARLVTWTDGGLGQGVLFEIRGERIHPNQIADCLEKLLTRIRYPD